MIGQTGRPTPVRCRFMDYGKTLSHLGAVTGT